MPVMRRISRIIMSAVLLITAVGSTADLSAKDRYRAPFYQGSDVRLTWGWMALDHPQLAWPGPEFSYRWYYYDNLAQYLVDSRYYGGDGYLTGAVSATYSYRFKRWLELSAVATYSGFHRPFYDKFTGDFAFRQNLCSISIMPYVRFNWLYRNWVRLYSGIGVGLSFIVDEAESVHESGVLPAAAVTPIGIAVGRDFYGLAELSLGTTGLIVVGVGYKF